MCRPYEETGAFRNIDRGRSQTGPRAATWGRPYWVTFSQRKAFGRPQGSPLRISKNGGRVWDPPLQKTKPFRVCRRGRILAGPSGNGRRLGRAARCAAPTAIQHRCRWFGKPRRRHGTAPAEIFANSGPVARREFRVSLRFCAPEIHCQAKGMTPVNGGPRGAANMDTKCPS